MKFSFAPLATLAVAASSLFLSAYAYVNYDDYGYDNLGARSNSIEVPFQHSLRSFLEEAVVAHRRALDDEDQIEARANMINVNFRLEPQNEVKQLSLATTTPIGLAIWQWHNRYYPDTGAFVVTELQVFIGERQIHVDWEGANDPTLAQLAVQDGTTIRLVITINMRTGAAGSKGADKKSPPKKAPAKKAPGKAPPAAKPAAPAKRR
ncbi:hypothetical protein DFP72DRAFT_911501 [Ephemerocybe angulata]|uniref:Uncharacterized protein n=1 Tax=Ephemerocybe angulata TaxID=980116 RepID=A0A8H6HNH6_9AGAR|nr:hypothetical protein DFP72DRAFT_911501 [Tulosesus angulatus]